MEDARLVTFHVIRTAKRKTVREVPEEIRTAQKEPIETTPSILAFPTVLVSRVVVPSIERSRWRPQDRPASSE